MTKAKVLFDPFSEEFFNNPSEVYRRMREEAPLYYDEEEDFYALTRHEDVAAAFKDFETYSSARGCDLAMVRKGVPMEQKSIIFTMTSALVGSTVPKYPTLSVRCQRVP